MKTSCTGVILAGGQCARFCGKNKAFFRVGDKSIFDRIYEVFNDLFDEIILITNNPLQYLKWNLNIVSDVFPIQSSLTGIHTGLFFTSNPHAFFAPCDTPFLKKELIEIIIDNIEQNVDIVIPETSSGFEPVCAVYSKKCLKPIEQNLMQRKLRIQQVFKKLRIKKISEKILREKDPDLLSFFNVNTPKDLIIAQNLTI